jgi:site-specific recombinase XerD
MNIDDLCDAFLKNCSARELAANTILAYSQDFKELRAFLGGSRLLSEICGADFVAYATWLASKRGLSSSTIKRRLAPLKAMLLWAERNGKLVQSPFRNLDLPISRPRTLLPRCLHRDEAQRIVRSEPRESIFKAAIALMLVTGVRVGELVSINIEDIDMQAGRIRIRGKGARERTVFVADLALRRRLTRLMGRRSHGPLFLRNGVAITTRQVRCELHRTAKNAGILRRLTPHMLRHTAATVLIEAGIDIRIVQRLLGHASILTTQIYAHVSDATLESALTRANILSSLSRSRP